MSHFPEPTLPRLPSLTQSKAEAWSTASGGKTQNPFGVTRPFFPLLKLGGLAGWKSQTEGFQADLGDRNIPHPIAEGEGSFLPLLSIQGQVLIPEAEAALAKAGASLPFLFLRCLRSR